MPDYLHLVLEGPMMSLGAAYGPPPQRDDFVTQTAGVPSSASHYLGRPMLVGLCANALGYDRSEGARHQALSDRMRFAAGIVREGRLREDFQTAQIRQDDRGWTTRGRVDGRRGAPATYVGPHLRRAQYWADREEVVMLRLHDGEGESQAQLAQALRSPERPLFLGRKALLPASPIYRGRVVAETAHAAVELETPWARDLVWDIGEGPDTAIRSSRDDRGWVAGVYQGEYEMHFDRRPDYD